MNIIIENKKIINSFKYAIEGIIASFKSERNMKIHVLATIIVVILGLILKINIVEWCFCIISIVLVISAELLNTAIENIVDMISTEKNEKAKLVKDISAGAVLVLAIGALIIGMIIFIPKIGW
jgi:diacylglycerol kinase